MAATTADADASPADDRLPDLAASAKLVHLVLAHEGALTQQEIAAETRLPLRTARKAARTLSDAGLCTRRPNPRDPRQFRYRLVDDPEGGA